MWHIALPILGIIPDENGPGCAEILMANSWETSYCG